MTGTTQCDVCKTIVFKPSQYQPVVELSYWTVKLCDGCWSNFIRLRSKTGPQTETPELIDTLVSNQKKRFDNTIEFTLLSNQKKTYGKNYSSKG